MAETRRTRNPEATRKRILDAAKLEFAKLGYAGARVDAIALRARTNKRMIYHYFHDKEGLFVAVLEAAYTHIRESEQRLRLEHLDPVEAIETLVTFTWNYYLKHPEFLTLVNTENLHRARFLKRSKATGEIHKPLRATVAAILDRGVASGAFRKDVDVDQLNLTIAAIGYYYLTNRFTNSLFLGRDLAAPRALRERIKFNVDTIRRLLGVKK